ncbi:MAG: hypothetical protein IAF08_09865, partial [Rhizobacter sp.]|nr:hypothetical protein [Chlorobiales bacterium]
MPQSPRPRFFISEPLPNRADGKALIDSNCTGFFKRHFDPRRLSAEHFTAEDLKRQTGLDWKALESRDSVIEFHRMFGDNKNKVVYVAEIIVSDRAEKRVMSIGSDDGFSLWVNGDSVASVHKGRSIEPNADLIPVMLRQGKNVVLYKVDQGDENWGLYHLLLSNADLNAVLRMKAGELYSDMAESYILPDTATALPLRADARRQVDSLHRISLRWKSLMSTERMNDAAPHASARSSAKMTQPVATSLQHLSWRAWELPREIKLPVSFNGLAVLETTVSDEHGHECYREDVPVFDAKTALVLAKELTKVAQPPQTAASKKGDPMLVARRAAVVELFALKPDTLVKTYSTRMKAHALADLYRYTRGTPAALSSFSGPQVWGYRNAKDSVCMFRVFVPVRLKDAPKDSRINSAGSGRSYPVVFLMYGSATSHFYMTRRATRSTEYQSIIVMQNLNEVENFLSDASA